jgi:hypothetical protein
MKTVMLEFGIEKGSHFFSSEAWWGAAPFPNSAKLTHTSNPREPSFWSKKTRNRPLGLAWARLRPLGLAWRGGGEKSFLRRQGGSFGGNRAQAGRVNHADPTARSARWKRLSNGGGLY